MKEIESVFDAWQEALFAVREAEGIFRSRSYEMVREMKDMTVAEAYKMNLIRLNFKSTLPKRAITDAFEI